MDLTDLIELAATYRGMGDAVAEQLTALTDRWDIEELIGQGELNPNALRYMIPFLDQAAWLGADDAQEALDLIHEYERGMAEAHR